ncbi:MAG: tRNA uridine-5-carboxymethylaminomethyl(34) synthesis enzyme MnmG [Rickettsiales bacterium]|nr:tRNA uridine-5-carboxymethylaminomethyl(34) synthesis enzyme MnmG [Rickettsiales bacterium]
MKKYDVIVIGGGHAGVEAAAAAARRGAMVLLLTKSPADLGAMSCNPSIGGPGKSQMVAEMAALGGIMPVAADMSAIQFRMLNMTHGPATRALRAQIDRNLYKKNISYLISHVPYLDVVYENVETVDLEKKIANGKYRSSALVLTTGTFLNGLATRGEKKIPSGRLCDDGTYQENATGISEILKKAGFSMLRLKTGTPARLFANSIDFSVCEEQKGDDPHDWFSIANQRQNAKQVSCFITHTTEETHKIIRENIKRAPMYNGDIKGIGPRYCPSIEDKVMKFPGHASHHVFLEPESLAGDIIYPNGLSTSFSAEIQDKFLRAIPGLENARVARYGYAIEYDAIDARDLRATLESKLIPGLFFAGQINGTSGYEEAAAQGVVAGANAAAFAIERETGDMGHEIKDTKHDNPYFIPDRTNSMIGVMIDDITTNGVDEPYRMFSSRAEYRLQLRADNAIFRLGETAVRLGLLSRKDYEKSCHLSSNQRMENDKLYAGYIAQQNAQIERIRRDKNIKIPAGLDFFALSGLTNELKQKLSRARPEDIAAASRIQGMTPAGIMVILRAARGGNSELFVIPVHVKQIVDRIGI